jgi:uncharacterized membrane protein
MFLLAHAEAGHGLGGILEPWEIHPILVHFPIAFLIGGVLLGLYAGWRRRVVLDQVATGLLIAGVVLGLLTGLAGFLAFFTVPAHTEEAHTLMYWHLGLQVVALLLFAGAAWLRWRAWTVPPGLGTRLLAWVATVVLVVGSGVGGYIVYHGAAGVEPELLSHEVRESHEHGGKAAHHEGPHQPGGHQHAESR